jgi:hypothetical protein
VSSLDLLNHAIDQVAIMAISTNLAAHRTIQNQPTIGSSNR